MEIDGNTLIFIIVLLFMFLSNPGGDGVNTKYEYNQLQQLKQQFSGEYDSFKAMNHSTNFKNITGFKLSYHDAVEEPSRNATYPIDGKEYNKWKVNENYLILPDDIINKVLTSVWDRTEVSGSFPPNITSTLYGKINLASNNKFEPIRMGIPNFYQAPTDFAQDQPPAGEYYLTPDNIPKYGEVHNVTFSRGKMEISISHLDEVWPTWRHPDNAAGKRFNSQDSKWKLLSLSLGFHDSKEHEKHSIDARAVYDVQRGQILFMSQSAKFHSIFALPHYMAILGDHDRYEEVAKLIDEYWKASEYNDTLTMKDLQWWYELANYKCEYVGYLQLKEWDKYTKDQIRMIDEELNWPIGRPVNMSDIPNIEISKGLLFSPDCGVELDLEEVAGIRYEVQVRSIRKHLLFGCLLFAAQIYLFILQMHYTNTPSAVNRISYWCLAMMNMVDGLLSAVYFFAALYKRELYLPLSVSSFACFILAAIFEIRYMISVYASQVNERGVSFWTLLRGGVADNRPPLAVIPDEAAISGSLYGRFIFTLVSSIFIVLSSFTWSKGIRTIFEYFCLTVLNSYWIPQIFRNAVKGNEPRHLRTRLNSGAANRNNSNRMPLLWKFIIGTTIIRIAPVIYLFTYSSNMFRHHRDTRFALLLSVWLLLQIAVLYSQDVFGARWFLLKHVIPEVYSYHKTVVSSDLLEHGSGGNYSVDCAICMSEVAVYVEDIPETHKANINEYMAAPCSHIFHTECLENWMSYKLQCPVCRAPLPPL